jgi:hypothetical protein
MVDHGDPRCRRGRAPDVPDDGGAASQVHGRRRHGTPDAPTMNALQAVVTVCVSVLLVFIAIGI